MRDLPWLGITEIFYQRLLNVEASPETAVSPGWQRKGTLPFLPCLTVPSALVCLAGAGLSACNHLVFWVSKLTQMEVDEQKLVAGKTKTHG